MAILNTYVSLPEGTGTAPPSTLLRDDFRRATFRSVFFHRSKSQRLFVRAFIICQREGG